MSQSEINLVHLIFATGSDASSLCEIVARRLKIIFKFNAGLEMLDHILFIWFAELIFS